MQFLEVQKKEKTGKEKKWNVENKEQKKKKGWRFTKKMRNWEIREGKERITMKMRERER